MTHFYEEQGWGLIETTLLGMYAKCLKETRRAEEYVNVLLKLLTKSAAAEDVRIRRLAARRDNNDISATPPALLPLGGSTVSRVDVRGYVSEVLALSKDI